jgi:hypothetical protein
LSVSGSAGSRQEAHWHFIVELVVLTVQIVALVISLVCCENEEWP